jgi:hypothetical protein
MVAGIVDRENGGHGRDLLGRGQTRYLVVGTDPTAGFTGMRRLVA